MKTSVVRRRGGRGAAIPRSGSFARASGASNNPERRYASRARADEPASSERGTDFDTEEHGRLVSADLAVDEE